MYTDISSEDNVQFALRIIISKRATLTRKFTFSHHLYRETMVASIYLLLVSFIAHSYQLNNGLGRTPQMGMMKITNLIQSSLLRSYINVSKITYCSIFMDIDKASSRR